MTTQKSSHLFFIVLLVLAEATVYLSNDMYLPALPLMVKDLGIDTQQIQLTLSSWFLGSMLLQLFTGPLSDRFGRKPILVSGMLLFVLSTFTCAYTENFQILLFARFLQGSTIGFVIVAGYASIHELFTQKEAIRLLATMSTVVILAPAGGPFLGSLVLQVTDWRAIFWFLEISGVVILLGFIISMREPLPIHKRSTLHLKTLRQQYQRILFNSRFMGFTLCECVVFGAFIAWLAAGPFLVVTRFGYNPLVFGLLQALIFTFFIMGLRVIKKLLDRINAHQLIKLGIGVSFLGSSVALTNSLLFPNALSGLITGMCIYSLGFGMVSPPLQRLAIESSAEPMGARMSILSAMMGLFGLIGTELISHFYNGEIFTLSFILLAASLIAVITILMNSSLRV